MRLDKDYLMEMELWSHFEMRGLVQSAAAPAPALMAIAAPAVTGPPETTSTRSTAAHSAATSIRAKPIKVSAPPADPARLASISAADWPTLADLSRACQACGLCAQRKNVVFGVGAQQATWLFIGEGPGADEDETGEPFVGQAGKLLDAMLTAAGLKRGREVYIANVVKCRPPGNRTPTADEALACAPLLDRQIDLIQPKIIVALGKTAMLRLTGSDAAMAAMRGRVHHYRGIPLVATYHPSYLLRTLTEKAKAWEDLQFAKATLAEHL